jgi:hypothetical protein
MATEIKELKTETSETFDLGDGRKQLLVYGGEKYYRDEDDELQLIDTNIVDGKVTKAPYIGEIIPGKIGVRVIKKADGSRIDKVLKRAGKHRPRYSKPVVEGNKAVWKNVAPGVNVILEFNPSTVRFWRVIEDERREHEITFEIVEDEKCSMKLTETPIAVDDENRNIALEVERGELWEDVSDETGKTILRKTVADKAKGVSKRRHSLTRVPVDDRAFYPLRIDPDDININTGTSGSDGYGRWYRYDYGGIGGTTTYVGGHLLDLEFLSRSTWYRRRIPWTRFTGITIPQNATIDNATLNMYCSFEGLYPPWADPLLLPSAQVVAEDASNPDQPTTNDINSLAAYWLDFPSASNKVTSALPTAGTTTTDSEYAARLGFDIQPIVQELVNSYDYDNDSMVFFIQAAGVTTGPYAHQFWANEGPVAAWTPNLVINYSEGSSTLPLKLNIGDTWREVESVKINIGDTWKDVTSMQINIGDTWKDVF